MGRKVLLVDDELTILLTLKAILEINGFEVTTANSAKEAVPKLEAASYDLVITDMNMEKEKSGFDVVRAASRQPYRPAVGILTAYPDLGADWKRQGADTLLVKPTNTQELLNKIEILLTEREIEQPQDVLLWD